MKISDAAHGLLNDFDNAVLVVRGCDLYAEIKPVPKQSVTIGAGGRVFTDAKKRRYVKMLADLLCDSYGTADKLTGTLRATVIYSFPWRKTDKEEAALHEWALMSARPDIDNLYKPLADAMQACVFGDDSQVVELRARKIRSAVPFIAVRIEEVRRNPGRAKP